MNITHLTSVHPRFDTRIFVKMCCSLASHGHIVSLVVADGKGDEVCEGVAIYDVGASKGRFDRIRNAPARVFAKAAALDADLYHLHDPELLPIGLKLMRMDKRVIFDSHEDVPRQMISKPYLNRPLRWLLARGLSMYERWACAQFDGVIAATPFIRDKFLRINPATVDINNFPLMDELVSETPWEEKQPEICYVGGISRIRGILEACDAMGLVQSAAQLNLGGRFSERDVEQQAQQSPGWPRVNAMGFLDRAAVRTVFSRSMAGLVTLHPTINYIDSLPVKMFEYMSAGIPVIASDFPLWREIITGNDSGLLVDPLNPAQIAEAIDYLVTHPVEAARMGNNGRAAVQEYYNWPNEERKLLGFYGRFLSQYGKSPD